MDPQQPPRRRVPEIKFRVLIIGRANAGKTSILQRVCDTTDSPVIYRGKKKITLEPSIDRGEHTINDELVFSNHTGYIFHDSRGIESGSTKELGILQNFIRRRCRERRLENRLHAIWYCVPMDNQRPELDLKFFKDICPDQNVPVVAVFTKYDQFRKNIRINVEDFGSPDDDVSQVTEENFEEYYLRPLGDDVRFVRLEKMHMQDMRCDKLIEATAEALNDDTTALMLLAVQKDNLKLGVDIAFIRAHPGTSDDSDKDVVRECLIAFPYIWMSEYEEPELDEELDEYYDRWLIVLYDDLRDLDLDDSVLENVMSLPTVTNLTATSLDRYHLAIAVIIILKHASSLRLSNLSPKSALTRAELDYREANIDSKIRQHLTASSFQEQSDQLSISFIMAIDLSKNTHA